MGSLPRDGEPIQLNGNIAVTCAIPKLVTSSADEAELSAFFLNTKEARIVRLMLTKLGHPQPQNPININNTIAVGIVNNTIKRQRSRAMEMRYFWLIDQETKKYFKFYYQPGQENLADYPSKTNTGTIHTHMRTYYLHMDSSPNLLTRADKTSARQGCTEILGDTYYKGIPLPMIPNNRAPGNDYPLKRTARAASVNFAQQTFNCPQRPRDTITTRLAPYLLNP